MANKGHETFRVIGQVIDRKSQSEVAELRVEAWDKDLIVNDLVGSAVTDEHGDFLIEFERSYFKELFLDRQPYLFFKVFRDGDIIKSTEDEVWWSVENGETGIVIEVNMPTVIEPGSNGDEPKQFVVKGEIRRADGTPLAAGIVRVFDRICEAEVLLGRTVTDKDGLYEITYSPERS